jgi:membrane-bound inhibitor of C-type lysozyme
LAVSLSAMAALAGAPAAAQNIQSYRCSDGTRFIVGFYEADPRAYMQIDGRAVPLRKRLAASGSRYSGSGVTLKIGKAGSITIRHAKRPVTACEPEERS